MKFTYPQIRRDDTVVDDYHGVPIADPYRWLEDPDAPEVKQFVEEQNSVTLPYLANCPAREDIQKRLTSLYNYPRYGCPFRHGNRYYFRKNSGLQNQSVYYVQDSLDDQPRVLLDPNLLSEDGTVAITTSSFSEDGEIMAYGLSSSGSDWITIRFRNVKTGEDYPEVIEKVKFTNIAWTHDNVGVFYGRYPLQEGKTDGSETTSNENQKVYYHRLGTSPEEDVLVVEFPEHPKWLLRPEVSDCGKYLLVYPAQECRDNLVFYAHLEDALKEGISSKLELTSLVTVFEADYTYVTNDDSVFYFLTNKNAPNNRIVAIDLKNPDINNWTTVVPENPKDVLDVAMVVAKDKLVLSYIQDVKSTLSLHRLQDGVLIKNFPLTVGSIVGHSGKREFSEFFYMFVSFSTPGQIFRVDLSNDSVEASLFREVKLDGFDASKFVTTQVFFPSKDGTQIPMFVTHKKDLPLDGNNVCLLTGYGGFNISLLPSFSPSRLLYIENLNGVVAIPNIRGGGEYGDRWHNSGRLLNKQNCFDDFQAAAEYLIGNGFTNPSKLIIIGGSNGGLLIGACINQRPDLYGAAIAQVGVMDMLRFHKFTIGYAWCSDYGCSDQKEHFENLYKFSPLHNINEPKNGRQYPAVLLQTADHDDRVVPLHSFKFISELQYKMGQLQQQSNPLLIRIETKAGHGGGKPISKQIEENTDTLSFILQSLGVKFQPA